MKNLILLAFISASTISFAQTKLTIQSPNEQVATVQSNLRNAARGDQGFWAARDVVINGKDTSSFIIRSFLQFDLSSIPQGSFINWARLDLYHEFAGGTGSFLLRRITSPWNEQSVTWNTQPTTALRASIRLPIVKTLGQNLKNLNVTNLLQNMVDSPSTSYGFELRLDSDARGNGGSVLFTSPSSNTPHYNPKLVLEYTTPGTNKKITSFSVGIDGEEIQMNIYPNPCHGGFSFDLQTTQQSSLNLKVIDMLGRTVYSQPVNTSNLQLRVNLPSGSAGTYFVILQDNKGATIVSQQLQVN